MILSSNRQIAVRVMIGVIALGVATVGGLTGIAIFAKRFLERHFAKSNHSSGEILLRELVIATPLIYGLTMAAIGIGMTAPIHNQQSSAPLQPKSALSMTATAQPGWQAHAVLPSVKIAGSCPATLSAQRLTLWNLAERQSLFLG